MHVAEEGRAQVVDHSLAGAQELRRLQVVKAHVGRDHDEVEADPLQKGRHVWRPALCARLDGDRQGSVDRLLPDPWPEERADVDACEDADALGELARVGAREAEEALQESGVPALVGDDVRINPVVAHMSSKASSAC